MHNFLVRRIYTAWIVEELEKNTTEHLVKKQVGGSVELDIHVVRGRKGGGGRTGQHMLKAVL